MLNRLAARLGKHVGYHQNPIRAERARRHLQKTSPIRILDEMDEDIERANNVVDAFRLRGVQVLNREVGSRVAYLRGGDCIGGNVKAMIFIAASEKFAGDAPVAATEIEHSPPFQHRRSLTHGLEEFRFAARIFLQ